MSKYCPDIDQASSLKRDPEVVVIDEFWSSMLNADRAYEICPCTLYQTQSGMNPHRLRYTMSQAF